MSLRALFFCPKGGGLETMDKIKEKQPEVASQTSNQAPQKITKKDIEYCMRHDAYRRGKGGGIKQIRR